MAKFNKKIVGAIKSDEYARKHQQKLKDRYNIPEEEKRIIVEKSNTLKFLIKASGNVIRIAMNIIIFFFAVVGVAALIYPESRSVLIDEFTKTYEQILMLF